MIVTGDLGLLHDIGALAALRDVSTPVRIIVIDNDGGGIFHFLPQRDALGPGRFEQLFGTPQRLDLVAVAQAHGVRAERTNTLAELREQLASGWGPRVLVVPTDREANVAEHERLHVRLVLQHRPQVRAVR